MVDVGYCINGKHGVIRNVKLNHMDRGFDSVWCESNQEELYRLKFENIEYIIPSECVGSLYTEEKIIDLCQKVDPPITFAEKFKEVFGFEPNKGVLLCEIINCNCRDSCQGCPYENNTWDEPYVKLEVEN